MLPCLAMEHLHVVDDAGRLDQRLELDDVVAPLDDAVQALDMAPVGSFLGGYGCLLQGDLKLVQIARNTP